MRIFSALTLLIFLYFITLNTVKAQATQFELSGKFTYELTTDNKLKVRQEIKIKNLESLSYSPTFAFDTTGFAPKNIAAFQNGSALQVTETNANSYTVKVAHPAVGVGAFATVVITFEDTSLIQKRGEILEMKIPRVNSIDFVNFTAVVKVPKEYSEKTHIYPKEEIHSTRGNFSEYTFSKATLLDKSLTAFIGDMATYEFSLKYPLENTSFLPKIVSFAVPPDTAYQDVMIASISDPTVTIRLDSDGNWIVDAKLDAKSTKTITVTGIVRVFADHRESFPSISKDALKLSTKADEYWQTEDTTIKNIAQNLKNTREIYDYVVNTLNYQKDKTKRTSARLGAKTSLENPDSAICMEFTDLFVALARAKGIPAREVNGYAVASDETRPRDLALDALHSWPEYWDESKLKWIPVDPTWGDTTGGVDYFSHFDLNHITFVIHGTNSQEPKTPGTFITKDTEPLVVVNTTNRNIDEQTSFIFLTEPNTLILKNTSAKALYNEPLFVKKDGKEVAKYVIPLLPPSGEFKVSDQTITGSVEVIFQGESQKIQMPIDYKIVIIISTVVFALTLTFGIYYIRLKK